MWRKLRQEKELDAIVDVIWKAQYYPYMPSTSSNFPAFGYSEEAREAGRAVASAPTNQWIYVRDHETNEIVAGTLWEWHDGKEPEDSIPVISVPWWPDKEAREFCEHIYRQAMPPCALWMR